MGHRITSFRIVEPECWNESLRLVDQPLIFTFLHALPLLAARVALRLCLLRGFRRGFSARRAPLEIILHHRSGS